MARSRLHLLDDARFSDFYDVMSVDRKHNRRTGDRFQCLFNDGSTIPCRTVAEVRRIGAIVRACHETEDIGMQVRAALAL